MTHAGCRRAIEALPVPAGGRALALGPEAPAEALAARGWQVTRSTGVEAPAGAHESFDLVVAPRCLGALQWDRWWLQELHAQLRTGGTLVVTVPNLASLVSPADAGFLAGRVLVQARRSLARTLRRAPPNVRFAGRRYTLARFLPLLAPLGFVDAMAEPAAGGPLVREFVVRARRIASRFGADDSRPWPAAAAHGEAYERGHADFIGRREAWLAAHPEYRGRPCTAFEPAAFAGREVLVLAPHPDDEVIGCGGTIAQLVKAGARVTVVQATDGSEAASLLDAPAATRRSVRLEEAAEVARALGIAEVVYWREDNGDFQARQERADALRELLAKLRPALVFTPFVADLHPDHRTLDALLAQALVGAGVETAIAQYEVWGLVPANRYADVTEHGALLERLLWLYRTAMKVEDYVHFGEDRNLYNAYARMGQPGRAEVFLQTGAAEFCALARQPA